MPEIAAGSVEALLLEVAFVIYFLFHSALLLPELWQLWHLETLWKTQIANTYILTVSPSCSQSLLAATSQAAGLAEPVTESRERLAVFCKESILSQQQASCHYALC